MPGLPPFSNNNRERLMTEVTTNEGEIDCYSRRAIEQAELEAEGQADD